MVSEKQLAANRLNAQKSTGPRTPAGKAVASRNAMTQGLTATETLILPGEDDAQFREFETMLRQSLKPRSAMQREIVDDIIQIRWKLRRIPRVEEQMMSDAQEQIEERFAYNRRMKRVNEEDAPRSAPIQVLASAFASSEDNSYARLDLHRMRLERSMHTAMRELRKLREEENENESPENEETLPRDTGLGSTELAKVRPVRSTQHGPDGHVTREPSSRKIEPISIPNPLSVQDQAILQPLKRSDPGIQSRDF